MSTYDRQERTKNGANCAVFRFLAQFALLKFDSYFHTKGRGIDGINLLFALKSKRCLCHTITTSEAALGR